MRTRATVAAIAVLTTHCYASHPPPAGGRTGDDPASCDAPAPHEAEPGWALTKLDPEPFDTRLTIDPDGFAHAAWNNYMTDATFYATNRGGTWTTEVVTEGGFGGTSPTAIVVTPDGTAHVLVFRYHVDEGHELFVATRSSPSWQLESVAASSDPYCADMEARRDGSLELVFLVPAPGGYGVQHATSRTGSWTGERVGEDLFVGSCSLAVAPDDTLRVALLTSGDPAGVALRLASNAEGPWQVAALDAPAAISSPIPVPVAVGPGGIVHVAYRGETDIVLLSIDGAAVRTERRPWPAGATDPQLFLEPPSTVHVAWLASDESFRVSLLHSSTRVEAWEPTVVTEIEEALYPPVLAVETPCCEGTPGAARMHFLVDDGGPGRGLYYAGPRARRCPR